jgi:hypothetical protein
MLWKAKGDKMKRLILMLTLVLAIFAVSCTKTNEPTACTMEAKICPDGSSVGRTGPNCEFAPCPESTTQESSSPENKTHVTCTETDRIASKCANETAPVCGWFNDYVKCIKYPCASLYANSCEACKNPNVGYYTEGECPKA